jgi:spore maturation protein SpmA
LKKIYTLEDLIFIYVLGPFFQKIVENVPEKNPFCGKVVRNFSTSAEGRII